MKNDFKNYPHLRIVLCKMCTMVNADFNKINFKDKNWFQKYSWTAKQEEDFKKWLCNYLKDNRQARNEMMQFPTDRKRSIQNFVEFFNMSHSWQVKEE